MIRKNPAARSEVLSFYLGVLNNAGVEALVGRCREGNAFRIALGIIVRLSAFLPDLGVWITAGIRSGGESNDGLCSCI